MKIIASCEPHPISLPSSWRTQFAKVLFAGYTGTERIQENLMIRLIDEIHRELGRLRYVPCPEELNCYPDGLVLCFRELPGRGELCRISEIGPPGRVTCLLESRKVLAALKQQEAGGDWYRAMRKMIDPEGTAPMEYVSP